MSIPFRDHRGRRSLGWKSESERGTARPPSCFRIRVSPLRDSLVVLEYLVRNLAVVHLVVVSEIRGDVEPLERLFA